MHMHMRKHNTLDNFLLSSLNSIIEMSKVLLKMNTILKLRENAHGVLKTLFNLLLFILEQLALYIV